VTQVLYFQDTELLKQQNLLDQLDRETYLGFLETDYYTRMKEEYKDELGLFGRVDAPKFIDPQLMDAVKENAHGSVSSQLDSYLSNRLESIIDDDSILD